MNVNVSFYRPTASYSGLGDDSTVVIPEPPSRATWFILGFITALAGPTLLSLFHAGGSKVRRRLEKD